MGRKACIDYPGAFHYIMSCGFKREILFDDVEDYKFYLSRFQEFKGYGYKILEYCLMLNYIYILL